MLFLVNRPSRKCTRGLHQLLYQKVSHSDPLTALDKANEQGSFLSTTLLSSALQWCIDIKDVKRGRGVYCKIVKKQLDSNAFLASYVVRLYAASGYLYDANKVFHTLSNPNVFIWTEIILAYANFGQGQHAIELYWSMLQHGVVKPDAHTFVAVLKACSTIAAMNEGKRVHAHVVESSWEIILHVRNILIDMYVRCGCPDDAYAVFDKMLVRDLVTWNSMIAGYSNMGHTEKAFELCQRMQGDGIEPDSVTLLNLLRSLSFTEGGSKRHRNSANHVDTGHGMSSQTGNSLLRLESAWKLFVNLPNRSLAAWSAMIASYADHGEHDKALSLYLQLLDGGLRPDIVTFVCALKVCTNLVMGLYIHSHIVENGYELDLQITNCLIDRYGQCGSLMDARMLFNNMHKQCVVTWSSIISAYTKYGEDHDSLELFAQMSREGVEPNQVAYFSAMKACSNMTAVRYSLLIYAHVVDTGWHSHMEVNNTAIDMFAKCGSLEDACQVFDLMRIRTVVTWSAMISGYSQHNEHALALRCFNDMLQEGIKPNDITYVCLLSVCNHLGLVNQGYQHFYTMQKVHGVKPTNEHRNCIVELLGRAGQLKEAADLLQGSLGEHDLVPWMSLLNQCKAHGNTELAKRCFDNIVIIDPYGESGYLYADLGMSWVHK